MTITAISKPLLPVIGASLLAFGCSTGNHPQLTTDPAPAASNGMAMAPSEGAAAQTIEVPAPKAAAPAEPETAFGGIVVSEPRPETPFETPTMSPAQGLAWVPGAWVWKGRWVWERGHWTRPPHMGAIWKSPEFFERDGKYIYVPGKWY